MAQKNLKVRDLSIPYSQEIVNVLQQCKIVLEQSASIRSTRDSSAAYLLTKAVGRFTSLQMIVTFKRIAEQLSELVDTDNAEVQNLIADCKYVFGYMFDAINMFHDFELAECTEFRQLVKAVDAKYKAEAARASNEAIILKEQSAIPGVFNTVRVEDSGVKISTQSTVLDMFMNYNVIFAAQLESLVKAAQDTHDNGTSISPKLELLLLYAPQLRKYLKKYKGDLTSTFIYFVTPHATTLAIQSHPVMDSNGIVQGANITNICEGHIIYGKEYKVLMLPFMITSEIFQS